MPSGTYPWVAKIQYEGKKPVWYGTIAMDANAKEFEVENAVRARAAERLPDGFKIIELQRGQFIFQPYRG